MKKRIYLSLAFCALSISFMFTYVAYTGEVHNIVVGCDGIENYYTGKGFWNDYEAMKSEIRAKTSGFTDMAGLNLYPPREMRNGVVFDCKTITNAYFCLCMAYNKTCEFESSFKYKSGFDGLIGHIGLFYHDDELYLRLN